MFGAAYAPNGPSQAIVLSDEAPGRLLSALMTAGYGELGLYDALVQIQQDSSPAITGGVTNPFLNKLRNCAAGSPIITRTVKSLPGTAVIGDDCSVETSGVQGSTFSGQPGTNTVATYIAGVGPAAVVYPAGSTPLISTVRTSRSAAGRPR